MPALACSDVTRHGVNKKIGTARVVASSPGPGEVALGTTSWVLNDLTVDGVDLSAIWARIGATDQLHAKAGTGDQTVTVTTNDGSAGGVTTLTVVEDSANGTLVGEDVSLYEVGSVVALCTAS